MRPSRLILCSLIATACLTVVAEAQSCYKKTDEHVVGNFFVKPMTDSTCFGQWFRTLLYYNYKTGDTLFSFNSEVYHPYPFIGGAIISDVLMFDSLLVLSWDRGAVYRILKVDFRGVVSEMPSALDHIPTLKDSRYGGSHPHKLSVVNDSVFLMSNASAVYSFHRATDTITCVDSVAIQGYWSALDLHGDTIVVVSGSDHEARFHYVDAAGLIMDSATISIDRDFSASDVYLRHGNLYLTDGSDLRVLLRTPEGFKLSPVSADDWTFGLTRLLFGKQNIIRVGLINDELWVYDRELHLLCNQSPVESPGAYASGIYGDKVFTANEESGIRTWIPDTSTTSISSPPVANHHSGIEVWPNPSASGMITVRSKEPATAIELSDARGRVVYRVNQSSGGAAIIPTSFLPSGVYFVNAQTAQGIRSERVVILRAW